MRKYLVIDCRDATILSAFDKTLSFSRNVGVSVLEEMMQHRFSFVPFSVKELDESKLSHQKQRIDIRSYPIENDSISKINFRYFRS